MQYEEVDAYGMTLFTTGHANALDSLEMVEYFLSMNRASKWKWAALGLHQASYGFLLEALGGTAPELYLAAVPKQRRALCLHVVAQKSASEIARDLQASEDDVKLWLSNPKVIGIDVALKRMTAAEVKVLEVDDGPSEGDIRECGGGEPARPASVKRLELSDGERKSIEWLIRELRNPFEHFMPKHWYIQLPGLPSKFLAVVDAIAFVALDSNGVILRPEEEKDLEELISRIRSLLVAEQDLLKAT